MSVTAVANTYRLAVRQKVAPSCRNTRAGRRVSHAVGHLTDGRSYAVQYDGLSRSGVSAQKCENAGMLQPTREA